MNVSDGPKPGGGGFKIMLTESAPEDSVNFPTNLVSKVAETSPLTTLTKLGAIGVRRSINSS